MENLEKTLKIIKEEYDSNEKKIEELNKKIKVININQIENKVISSLCFSTIPWIAIVFLMPTIIKSGIVPDNLIQPLSICISALIGTTTDQALSKKYKHKEILKKFTNAKTEKDKLEEIIKCEIEKEKLINSNKVLTKVYEDLKTKQSLFSSISNEYNITEIETKTKDEMEKNIKNLNELLEQHQKDINIITTKFVLGEKFWNIRNKLEKFNELMTIPLIGTLVFLLVNNFPIMYAFMINKDLIFNFSSLGFVMPTIVGLGVGSTYSIKRLKNYTTVFNKINKELGENSILEFVKNNEEQEMLNENLEATIERTYRLKQQLESEKRKIEKLEPTKKTYTKPTISAKTIEDTKNYPELYNKEQNNSLKRCLRKNK